MDYFNSYSVYNRQNEQCIYEGTFQDIQHYLGNKKCYQIIWNYSGDEITEYYSYWMF